MINITNAALLDQLATLRAENEELRKRERQSAQVALNHRRKTRVHGLGLVFGSRVENPETGEVSYEMGIGEPRMEYQDHLFEENERGWASVAPDGSVRLVHLTDEQLLILNRVEHPECTGRMELDTIRAMRRLYNEGRHSKKYGVPEVKSRAYTRDAAPVAVAV